MSSRRAAKVARRIQQDASEIILYELHDPRIEQVTITKVDISDDLRHATIYFSVLGSEGKRRAAARGLASASGLVRSRIAKGLGLREAPDIAFQFDPSIEKAIEISKLIDQVAAEYKDRDEAGADPGTEDGEDEEDEEDGES